MFLKLPIADVDKLSDIALGKKGNLTYQRVESTTPLKITYTVTFKGPDFPSWNFHIHEMAGGTEITFPVYVPEFDVLPANQFKSGAVLSILECEKEPVYDDLFEKAEYEICQSIWQRLKLQETLQRNRGEIPDITRPRSIGEIRVLEKLVKAGDENAKKKLDELKKKGEYDESYSSIQELISALPRNELDSLLGKIPLPENPMSEQAKSIMEEIQKTQNATMEQLKKAAESSHLKEALMIANPNNLVSDERFAFENLLPLQTHEERLADEMAENNRLNREILKELKNQRQLTEAKVNENDIAKPIQSVSISIKKETVKNKRGPHRYSRKEKLDALDEWDELDREEFPITLEEWLDEKFGNNGGILNVAPSTFHGWRRKLRKS